MASDEPSPETERCEQCGRVGTRGFKVIPAQAGRPFGQWSGPWVVCANEHACRQRWPRGTGDGE